MDNKKFLSVNENDKHVQDNKSINSKGNNVKKNTGTFLGLLAVSAVTIAASAIYTKKGIENIEKNGK